MIRATTCKPKQKLTDYFRRYNGRVYNAKVTLDAKLFEEELVFNAALLKELSKIAERKRILGENQDAAKNDEAKVITDIEKEIDSFADDFAKATESNVAKRNYLNRTEISNWKVLGEPFAINRSYTKTVKEFPEAFVDCSDHAGYQRCLQLSKDYNNSKRNVINSKRKSVLGPDLEKKLLASIDERCKVGWSIDNEILRTFIIGLLESKKHFDLFYLHDNGPKNVHHFANNWCQRFF